MGVRDPSTWPSPLRPRGNSRELVTARTQPLGPSVLMGAGQPVQSLCNFRAQRRRHGVGEQFKVPLCTHSSLGAWFLCHAPCRHSFWLESAARPAVEIFPEDLWKLKNQEPKRGPLPAWSWQEELSPRLPVQSMVPAFRTLEGSPPAGWACRSAPLREAASCMGQPGLETWAHKDSPGFVVREAEGGWRGVLPRPRAGSGRGGVCTPGPGERISQCPRARSAAFPDTAEMTQQVTTPVSPFKLVAHLRGREGEREEGGRVLVI